MAIKIAYYKDQFHPKVKEDVFRKFVHLPYYSFDSLHLKERDIISIGCAKDNNIGSEYYAKTQLRKFNKVNPYLKVVGIEESRLTIDTFYLTSLGKFGSKPTDASWDMIDSKYKLDIFKDSLFQDCLFAEYIYRGLHSPKSFPYLKIPPKLIEDYQKAANLGLRDIFLYDLNKNLVQYYEKSYVPKRVQ